AVRDNGVVPALLGRAQWLAAGNLVDQVLLHLRQDIAAGRVGGVAQHAVVPGLLRGRQRLAGVELVDDALLVVDLVLQRLLVGELLLVLIVPGLLVGCQGLAGRHLVEDRLFPGLLAAGKLVLVGLPATVVQAPEQVGHRLVKRAAGLPDFV